MGLPSIAMCAVYGSMVVVLVQVTGYIKGNSNSTAYYILSRTHGHTHKRNWVCKCGPFQQTFLNNYKYEIFKTQ